MMAGVVLCSCCGGVVWCGCCEVVEEKEGVKICY